jgi:uncharacterized protein YceK
MRYFAVALSGVVMLSGCASLLTPSGSAATRWANLEKSRAAKAAGMESNQICKTLNVTGSNFPQQVCSTQDEWDQFNAEQRQAVDELDRARRAGN